MALPDPNIEEVADGLAMWEEFKPQTGEDWIEVGRRSLDSDLSAASPIFAGLVEAVRKAEQSAAELTRLQEELERERDALKRAEEATQRMVVERDHFAAELENERQARQLDIARVRELPEVARQDSTST